MNTKIEQDILLYLEEQIFQSQRQLSEELECSLGRINQGLKSLQEEGFLTEDMQLTQKAREEITAKSPKQAIILAAGAGMRMVPINTEVSKGMLTVKNEVLVERLIRQLHEVSISKIYIVVGFMKEQYEYLIDKFQVELIVNPQYDTKNNLISLNYVKDRLKNTYILPCDLWCEKNPFRKKELYSWYLVQKELHPESDVLLNRKHELVRVKKQESGNRMTGICYLDEKMGELLQNRIKEMAESGSYDECFWEEALYEKQKMLVKGRIDEDKNIHEINTYEQLREIDSNAEQLNHDIIRLIAQNFGVEQTEVRDIEVLKKGMTNRSFKFSCKGKRFIMRIPGAGTDQLINREQEYMVYKSIEKEGICDDIYYMNPQNGYKITEFLENARNCDAANRQEVQECMEFLRKFHERKLRVAHTFDLFGQIEYYESLWNGQPSVYRDYKETKENVLKLKSYIDAQKKDWCLTHIDAVPDNFLITEKGIRLIDWEYAGMQDPHLDIAMFAIYSLYQREEVEYLIDSYFQGECAWDVRLKIYCYIAVAGMLWSNWCEYKHQLGVEFGEYSLRQYRYAKEYYRLFIQLSEKGEKEDA